MEIKHIISQIDSEVPTGATIVAEESGTLVGALTLSLNEGPGGCIRSCYVHPEHRSKGVGRTMIERAKANKKTSVILGVKDTNTGAQNLYNELGFVPFSLGWSEGYTKRILVFTQQAKY